LGGKAEMALQHHEEHGAQRARDERQREDREGVEDTVDPAGERKEHLGKRQHAADAEHEEVEGLASASHHHADSEVSRRHLLRVGTIAMRMREQTGDRLDVAGRHGDSLATIVRRWLDKPAATSRNAATDSTWPPDTPLQLRNQA